ncbi:MAG: hypothetical protein KJ698_02690, partial [Actinobacteria bacterium]|nr:hypothetical protein [Actinomycetota bacterium]
MRRYWAILMVLALAAGACGEGGAVVTTGSPGTTAAPGTSATSLIPVVPASAGAALTGSLVLLADDFQDGDAAGWEVGAGWYVLGVGEAYGLAASGPAWGWWPGGEGWEPRYLLRASFRVDTGGLAVSVTVGDEGRYVVHLHEEGTDLLLDRPWGTFETLATTGPVETAAWHLLAVGIDGADLRVYVDGEPWLAVAVDEPLTGGSVGFGALEGSLVAIDNVYVTVLVRELPGLAAGGGEPVEPVVAAAAPPVVAAPPGEEPGPAPPEGGEEPGPEPSEGGEEPGPEPSEGGEEPGPEPPEGGEEPPGAPDLRVVSIAFHEAEQLSEEPVGVDISVINEGAVASGPFEAAWEAMGSACSAAVPALDPGAEVRVSCTAAPLPPGLFTWTVDADHDNRVEESDEGDNGFSGTIEVHVAAATQVDLAVGAASYPPVEENQEFLFEVEAVDLNATGFPGLFTMRLTLDGALVCSRDMPVGSTASCAIPGLETGSHLFEAVVDPDGEIDEVREDNNRRVFEVVVEAG